MRLAALELRRFAVRFRTPVAHAAATRRQTSNIIVIARGADGSVGFGEGCPRPYVTGESEHSAASFVAAAADDVIANVTDLDDLRAWIDAHEADIDDNPAAFAALELAILDLLARQDTQPVETLLGLLGPTRAFRYSAVVGDSSATKLVLRLLRYRLAGFADFKIKIIADATRDRRKEALLRLIHGTGCRLRADANNAWSDAEGFIRDLGPMKDLFVAIEEPVKAGDLDGCRSIAKALRVRIVLDESLCRLAQAEALSRDPETWIANIRVSKMGGLIRSLRVADRLVSMGVTLIVGAQVGETSLLTRAGLAVAAAHQEHLFAQEGAFGTHLLAHDLCDPPVMFGRRGLLADAGAILKRPGWGVEVRQERLTD
ncbi:MAG: hypothetical protein GY791_18750 [Alphaproteobacteria bacterium]|nr:hypothetical protein [Alphaproteobacteria bacterium]